VIGEKLILEYWTNKPDSKFCTYIHASLYLELVLWYHLQLLHPGATRMINAITQHFAWPKMHATIWAEVINCRDCQRYRITVGRRYGHLTRNNHDHPTPWKDVHVDLISPWSVDVKYPDGATHPKEITALTAIDSATQWPEIIPTRNISSFHIAKQFDANWFCR